MIALLGSCVVYLVPLVGPHAFFLTGEQLIADLGGDKAWAWKLTDVAVALVAQCIVWIVLRWSLAGSLWRKLAWLGMFPLVIGLNIAYLSAIPAYFLIEPDTAPESTTWIERCSVKARSLVGIRGGVTQPDAGPTSFWIAKPDGGYAILRASDCSTTDVDLPRPTVQPGGRVDFLIGLQFVQPDGPAIVERTDPPTGQRTWFLLARPDAPLRSLATPPDVPSPPIVSRDGQALAYLQTVTGSGPPVLEQVLVRKATPDSAVAEVDVELAQFGAAAYTLLDIDAASRELLLWRNDAPMRVTFDGQQGPLAFDAADTRPQPSTYLRLSNGWVTWDAYRDEGAYGVAWSIDGKTGARRTNLGRSVAAAAVSPDGQLIAISETTALSIGSARDLVTIVRTDTGAEIFRRYLARYSRTPLVFFDDRLFGYSDDDGVHVLEIPEQ